MSITSLIAIFIGIGILTIVSIFFGIINWIDLVSTSSSINQLQTELEKKYKESDSQKKSAPAPDGYPPPQPPAAAGPDMTGLQQPPPALPEQEEEQQQIEIIRNVRGEFASTEQSKMHSQTIPIQKPHSVDPVSSEETGEFQQPPISPVQTVPDSYRDFQPEVNKPAEEKVTQEDVTVYRDEMETMTPPASESGSITIPLYSNASQDADFNTLWKTLSGHLTTTDHLRAIIDFKNILFLYEKEIEYLRKIHKAIELNHGTLSFIQCSSELISTLNNDPILKNLIVKE